MAEIVRKTEIRTGDRELTVSTVKYGPWNYGTVIFDDSDDRRFEGKIIGGDKSYLYTFIIDESEKEDSTREDAMTTHHQVYLLARDEKIRPRLGGNN